MKPNGANNIPVEILPFLEQYKKIYLWMDADAAGVQNAPKIAEKLGIHRTYIVNSKFMSVDGPKDANDALIEDPKSLIKYIEASKTHFSQNITNF